MLFQDVVAHEIVDRRERGKADRSDHGLQVRIELRAPPVDPQEVGEAAVVLFLGCTYPAAALLDGVPENARSLETVTVVHLHVVYPSALQDPFMLPRVALGEGFHHDARAKASFAVRELQDHVADAVLAHVVQRVGADLAPAVAFQRPRCPAVTGCRVEPDPADLRNERVLDGIYDR